MGSSWRKIATHSSRSCRYSRFFLNPPSPKVSTFRLAVAWWWRASSWRSKAAKRRRFLRSPEARVDLRHKLCADRTDSGQLQLRLRHLGRCSLLFLGRVVCQRGLHRSGFAEHLHQRRGCSSRRESCSTPSTHSGVAGPAYWMLREISLRREFCRSVRRVIGTTEAVIPRAVSKPYESAAETLFLGFASAGSRRAPGQLTKTRRSG
jgi:hypothetical protein